MINKKEGTLKVNRYTMIGGKIVSTVEIEFKDSHMALDMHRLKRNATKTLHKPR